MSKEIPHINENIMRGHKCMCACVNNQKNLLNPV